MTLNGTLSLHGVTGTVPVTAQVALIGDMLRASGEFSHSAKQLRHPTCECGRRAR